MRHIPPDRCGVADDVFAQPIFDGFGMHADLLRGAEWPSLAELNARLGKRLHPFSHAELRFQAQTPALLSDQLHYEARIFTRGLIATRSANWHDLMNGLVWCTQPMVKAAMNFRQHLDVGRVGNRQRTRGQCALTHFDEAGVLLVLRKPELVAAWDRHDWIAFFAGLGEDEFALAIVGHALLEHALTPTRLLAGKALVAVSGRPRRELAMALDRVAQGIAEATLLVDPQELRPLPLAGLPGWHAGSAAPNFLLESPCFQPLRAGRVYPAPMWSLSGSV